MLEQSETGNEFSRIGLVSTAIIVIVIVIVVRSIIVLSLNGS